MFFFEIFIVVKNGFVYENYNIFTLIGLLACQFAYIEDN